MKSVLYSFLIGAVLSIGLSSCGHSKRCAKKADITKESEMESEDKQEKIKESAMNDIYGVKTLNGKDVSDLGITMELHLNENRISGNGGCNSYSANFTEDEEGIKIGYARATKMACQNLDAEKEFFQTLPLVDAYKIKKELLSLQVEGVSVVEAVRMD